MRSYLVSRESLSGAHLGDIVGDDYDPVCITEWVAGRRESYPPLRTYYNEGLATRLAGNIFNTRPFWQSPLPNGGYVVHRLVAAELAKRCDVKVAELEWGRTFWIPQYPGRSPHPLLTPFQPMLEKSKSFRWRFDWASLPSDGEVPPPSCYVEVCFPLGSGEFAEDVASRDTDVIGECEIAGPRVVERHGAVHYWWGLVCRPDVAEVLSPFLVRPYMTLKTCEFTEERLAVVERPDVRGLPLLGEERRNR